MVISEELKKLGEEAESALAPRFAEIDRISGVGTEKVLESFRRHRVSESHFAPSTGYGYDDKGRDTLDEIYADVLGTEAAFVRHGITSGTHALTIGLFGLLRPGDTLLAVTGKPYDTLDGVIGIDGRSGMGSLADFGVSFKKVELREGIFTDPSYTHPVSDIVDLEGVAQALAEDKSIRVVFIQRSKGYLDRPTLTVAQMNELIDFIRSRSDAYVFVDNCYGEFTEETEPHADLLVGSLIKNIGGGIAESGGYIAGTREAVQLCGYRLTAPGIGLEGGATLGNTRSMYKGLFFAPHVVAQAIKTASFAAYIFERLGCRVEPRYDAPRSDIIQLIHLGSAERLCAFCRGIQYGSPVDSFVSPEPYQMPGYSSPVIMAAGAFTQGSSIELSADGPVRPPYTAYLQGGLTYESGRYGVMHAAQYFLDAEK